MAKTLILDPIWGPQIFSRIVPLLEDRQGSKLSSYANATKINKLNLKK